MNTITNTFQHKDIDLLIGQLHKVLNTYNLKIEEMENEREKVIKQLEVEEDWGEIEELQKQQSFIDGYIIAMGNCDDAVRDVINSYVGNEIQRMLKEGAK